MSTFTEDFFGSTETTNKIIKNKSSSSSSSSSSNSSTKKKKKEVDVEDFTNSFFSNYYDDDYENSHEYTEEFVNEYNSFIDRLNKGAEERYQEAKNKAESGALYYEYSKQNIKDKRSKSLVYNWNLDDSGGLYNDYGYVPVQDKNGYLKKTDKNGNVYWVDIKEDLLYDGDYNLINDDRLKDANFINSLEYEYDKHNKLDSKYLTKADKIGLNTIDKTQYMSIVNDQLYDQKTVNFDKNPVAQNGKDKYGYINEHTKDGWIVEDGKYYKPINYSPINFDEKKNNDPKFKAVDGKIYEVVNNETPKQAFQGFQTFNSPKPGAFSGPWEPTTPQELSATIYEENFKKLNKAIEKGDLTTANNALQVINNKYFGHSYDDSFSAAIFNTNNDDISFFEKRFSDNVERLNVINNSITNTSDAQLLEELNKEKDKLELENTLIQYNRILCVQSAFNKTDKIDKIYDPVDEAWDKVGTLWNETFEDWDDGYDFGDVFRSVKNIFNNSVQSLGALGKQTNAGFQAIGSYITSDMDDSEFKDKWLPAILDVGTYLIPYVGQARFIINMAEPTSVVTSFVTQEGSATIDSGDGDPRVANGWNAIGAIINIAANFISNKIFKNMRVRLGEEGTKKIYEKTARGIATLILKEAGSEAAEEFVQTYAETMQNMDYSFGEDGDPVLEDIWQFAKEYFDESMDAALIAFVTSGMASGTSIAIDTIRTGDIHKVVMEHAEIGDIDPKGEIENIRLNQDLSENNNILYNSTDTDGYEKMQNVDSRTSDIKTDTDENVAQDIAEQLSNNQIVSIVSNDAITKGTDITLDNTTTGSTQLADSVIDSNTKTVLVSSKEMETYLKSLRPDLVTYVFDPKSETFMDDIRTYVKDVAKSNIVPKNVSDFTVNNYKLTPDEMVDINKMVNEYTNKANLLDSVNNPDTYKLNPSITVSDITDSDINTILNSIKTKFLNDIDNGRYSKETAQKEFKSLSNKLSEYVLKTKENRTYLKDAKNNIVVFSKKGDNYYEAVNTLPRGTADLSLLANVKTNGNIINGNLSTKVSFAKKQLNATNTLIDKLKLKGNYLTPDSTYKDVAGLVKMNRNMSGEILQSLGADGLIEGKNKVRLYTAFNNLDNANMNKTVKNTVNYMKSESFNKELDKKVETTAPRTVNLKPEESKVSVEEKPINIKENAMNPENPSELNNIELEKIFNDSFKDLQIKNKLSKDNIAELKNIVKNAVFDGYSHIADIANVNEDFAVKNAIYNMQSVANDAQTMISGAQMKDGEVIGKSLKQIYSDNKIKSKNSREMFEKTMLHALNAERERAGVDKIFENISAKKSEAIVNRMFEKNPNFKEAANDLQRYNNNLLDMLVDGGVISESLSNKLKGRYKYYMPIYSSELSTFADLDSEKYLKSLSLDNAIKDVTKTGKQILSLEKSMENKTYNVLSAIAKNKLAQEMSLSNKYEGDSDLLYYNNGELTKTKVSKEILSDINNNRASHIADVIHDIPVLKQMIDLSNMSYKFILDPIYQIKNITIDFADSALIYSKDKAHFIPNYFKAIHAVANNSEAFHEALANGLGNIGEGWNAPKVKYDADGNINLKQNKFQRLYANLEAMPKLAEYFSLKDKYSKQVEKDYKSGKYDIEDNHLKFNDDEKYAINKWVGSESYLINEHYRYGYDIDERLQNISDNLDSVLTKIKSESGEYHRSIPLEGERLQQFINKYKKGEIVTEEAFTSMTPKGDIYDESFNIQMDITSKNAKDTHNLMRKSENEYMLQRNTQFRVDDVNIDGDNVYLKLTDVTDDKTTIFKNNISLNEALDSTKMRAMLDASDVNLNFNRGGKVTKALSKSGFKFLNAGIQGFDKFITHVGEGVKTPKGMGSLLLEFSAVGIGTAVANALLNDDDEDYDKLPYYYKNNYYMIKIADGQYFRIPKGRVQTLYNVLFEYSTGLRKEDSAQDYIDSLSSAFDLAVVPPALEQSSPISAYVQVFSNKDAFGNEIYSDKYDSTGQKVQKSIYHLLSNYFGRYGRIVKDVTDGDSTTDLFNEFDFYKDTTKANRHYNTALNLVEYYQNSNNVKTLDDKAMKKYIDTQNYALRSINSEINQGKRAGLKTSELKEKYAARDDLLKSMINNYKNFDTEVDEDGNTWYYFDEHCFMYNAKTQKFVKKY